MANLSGISYDHRMTEDTGASITDVSRAWLAVREVLDFPAWWDEIGELTDIALDDLLDLYLDCRRAAERCSLWILRHRRPPVDIALEVERFREPVQAFTTGLVDCLRGALREAVDAMTRATDRARRARGTRRTFRRVAPAAHDVRRDRARRAGRRLGPGGVRQLLGVVRPARADVAVGRHRRAAALRSVADAGPRGSFRDDLLTALVRADRERARQPGAHGRAVVGREPAIGAAGDGAAHRDPARRRLRHHEPVGRAAPAAQPGARLRPPCLTSPVLTVRIASSGSWVPLLATGSRRRRPATSTSAGRARHCSTGRWRGRAAARSCCASRTPTRPATGRSGRRGSSTRWHGSASPPTTRTSRARCSRATTSTPTWRRPSGCSRAVMPTTAT